MERTGRTPAAILVDFDGVIVDSEAIHHRAFDLAFAEIGLPPIPFAVYAENWSNGYWRDYAAHRYPGVDLASVKRRKDGLFLELLRSAAPMIPGVDSAVRRLSERWPLILATGTAREPALLALRQLGLVDCFQALVTREDYAREKPEPDAFVCAAGKAGTLPSACLAIEDSLKGLRAALAAGTPCVVIPNDYTRGADFSGASATLATIQELTLHRVEEIYGGVASDDR